LVGEDPDCPLETKVFIAAAAAVYGDKEACEYVLSCLARYGPRDFLEVFFVTKDDYKYYGGRRDHFITQAILLIQNPKFVYLRCIYFMLLAGLQVRPAETILRAISNNPAEEVFIQEKASEALDLMTPEVTA
jgi:hypothetical protein